MTPEAVTARLEALRAAGAALRRRPFAATLDLLAGVLDVWRDPHSRWRHTLESELPKATGFAPETVREGLRAGLEGWSGEALCGLVRRELGDAAERGTAAGFDTTAVVLAGAIPMPALLALVAPLVLRSPVLAKTASADPVTAPLVCASLAEADAELGACAHAVTFPGRDAGCTDALVRADCVDLTGGDASVAEIAARVPVSRRLLVAGHRVSLAALGPEATRGAALREAAAGLARDAALWDQLGCLSPVSVHVAGADAAAPDRVADALAEALAEAEERWPRGAVPAHAAAAAQRERAEAEMRAASGLPVRVLSPPGAGFTVVRESGPELRPAPLHRFLRVHPAADGEALLGALAPLRRHLAAVALAGLGPDAPGLARALVRAGASRVCAPGRLQAPPLAWRREGRGVLLPLARLADLEQPPRT